MHAHTLPPGEKKKSLFQLVQIVYFNGKERREGNSDQSPVPTTNQKSNPSDCFDLWFACVTMINAHNWGGVESQSNVKLGEVA